MHFIFYFTQIIRVFGETFASFATILRLTFFIWISLLAIYGLSIGQICCEPYVKCLPLIFAPYYIWTSGSTLFHIFDEFLTPIVIIGTEVHTQSETELRRLPLLQEIYKSYEMSVRGTEELLPNQRSLRWLTICELFKTDSGFQTIIDSI